MNTLLTALLVPATADAAPVKNVEPSDISKTPAQSDKFAQTFRGTTERSQRQSDGEHLPSSGKGGNATPPPRTPARASSHAHRPEPVTRTAKAKPTTRNAQPATATDADAPPPSTPASAVAPVQRPPLQAAGSGRAQAPSPIVATGPAKQTSVAAAPAEMDTDPTVDIAKATQTSAGGGVPLAGANAAPTVAQPHAGAAISANSFDTGAVGAGADAATPVDVTSRAETFSADSVAAATFTLESPAPPLALAKVAARVPALQATSNTAPADSAASPSSLATDIGKVVASPTTGADQAAALNPTVQGNPSPPLVNSMALDLGAQAAAANQGLTAPVDSKAGAGGVAAPTAMATRLRLAGTVELDDKEPAVAQQDSPGNAFAAVQALVNADTSANGPGSTAAASAPILNVAQPVESQDFGRGVANQVSVMVDNNLNVAKLQVNPGSLGPIEVRIALQAGHAQVWMTSHSAVTRDALQDSASHLKDILGQQGFGQVSVDISHRQFQERAPQSFTYERNRASEENAINAPGQTAAPLAARRSDAKLDAYA